MAEMEKSWEQKLAETKEKEEEEKRIREEEEKARIAGTPHLINLNEDPMLDRKVIYDINQEAELMCGRRNKQSNFKLQLGGTGIQPEHCKFVNDGDKVMCIPLSEKAMPHIHINGQKMSSMDGVELKPNDRICIGPSAIFLFKNKQKEADASIPDPDDDPISFDFASDEVANAENAAEREEQEKMKQIQEELNKKLLKEMEEKAQKDAESYMDELKAREAELEAVRAEGNDERIKELERQVEELKARASSFEEEKIKKLMAESVKQKAMAAEYNRIEKELNHLLPLVNEANLASTELQRDLKFNTKLVKRLDPFSADHASKTEILVKIDNNEESYFYEWTSEKFQNRLFMIRELLEDYFDTGELPKLDKDKDPFWDPPNPILLGQSFLQLQPLGLGFENQLEAAILSIDGNSGRQGTLTIGYNPCTQNGEIDEDLLPEELLVDTPEQLEGFKNLYFKVFVTNAKDLPETANCNPFVTYSFKFKKGKQFQTPEIDGLQPNPEWKYEKMHCIDEVTPQIIDDLKNSSISFMVYAYPPMRENIKINENLNLGQKKQEALDLEARVLGLDDPEEANKKRMQEI